MKVLITGAGGQLGKALQACAPADAVIIPLGHGDLDITDSRAVSEIVADNRPDLILNAAAYTAVDKAESDVETARAINAVGPANLALAAREMGARLVHVSTDFVFDGVSGVPHRPDAPTAPIGVYGATKRDGEEAVLSTKPDALIVRTAWVYGSTGSNFVRTMLRLMAERDEVRVVVDQIGSPTFAGGLAQAIWALDAVGAAGIHHWTDSGAASWYDFAVAIQEEALALGLLSRRASVLPIPTTAYPTPARRPHYSVLNKEATFALLGKPAPHWRENLRRMLKDIQTNG